MYIFHTKGNKKQSDFNIMSKQKHTVAQVLPTQSGTSQAGKPWEKTTLVLSSKQGDREKLLAVEFWGADSQFAAGLVAGEEIETMIDVESKEWKGKWYTNVKGYGLQRPRSGSVGSDATTSTTPTASIPAPTPPQPKKEEAPIADEMEDDLPF